LTGILPVALPIVEKQKPMKKWMLLLSLPFLTVMVCAQTSLNVMTFNIRWNNAGDGVNAWPERKQKAASQIAFHEADIVGVQEALHGQLIDLDSLLPGFDYTGGGRDDGKTKGEYSAILYRTSRLQMIAGSTFWLSQTPLVAGSKGWDANLPRVVTWAKFKDKKSQRIFFVFNTHFDHIGEVARRESAKLLVKAVDSIAGKIPTIITGDFNSKPFDEPIKVITNADDPLRLTDTKATSTTPHYGPTGTFNGFEAMEKDEFPIDYIFTKGKFKVLQHATLSQSWQGRFSSDHFPVFARLIIL
jgi:endonuclease/exonuclease/phosphatase family metal-dependent hydrolase